MKKRHKKPGRKPIVRDKILEVLAKDGDILTNQEIAERVGCDRNTVGYWRKHKDNPHRKKPKGKSSNQTEILEEYERMFPEQPGDWEVEHVKGGIRMAQNIAVKIPSRQRIDRMKRLLREYRDNSQPEIIDVSTGDRL